MICSCSTFLIGYNGLEKGQSYFNASFFHNISIIYVSLIHISYIWYIHWIQKSHENADAKEKCYSKKDVNPMCGNFTGVQRKLAIQNSIFVRSKFICYSTKEKFLQKFSILKRRQSKKSTALHCTEVRRAPLIDFQNFFFK
mgnify:CR=1 FL=1